LAKTRNEAVAPALLATLDSPHAAIAEAAVKAIFDRRSPTGMREIIRRMDTLGERWKEIINERRGRMPAPLRDALLGGDDRMCANACLAIDWFREYDLTPALVNACEDTASRHNDLAGATLLKLAELLYEELCQPRDYNDRRDPQMVRQHVVATLERSAFRFASHKRTEPVEAFLMLVGRDNATLKKILLDPHDGCYLPVVNVLLHSKRPGVLRLVLSFLEDPDAPSAAITAISRRGDREFVEKLLKKLGPEPSVTARTNLKRLKSIAWVRSGTELLGELDEASQHAAVQMVMASGMKRLDTFALVEFLLIEGRGGGRRAAARALESFQGAAANDLVQRMLHDDDPQVQAEIVAQLRPRGIHGALTILIDMVDSPYEVVRRAARDSLEEFSFHRFLAAFDMLEEDARATTGRLVKKIDPQTIPTLAREMESQSRTRRIRALAVAAAIGAVMELERTILERLEDEDHLVRVEAVRALAQCNTQTTVEALEQMTEDKSIAVQEAVERSLAQLAGSPPASPAAMPPVPPVSGPSSLSEPFPWQV